MGTGILTGPRLAGTVRWHALGLAPAVAADRHDHHRPPGQRPWYLPPDAWHRIGRTGGMLTLTAMEPELRIWAVAVG